MRHVVWMVVWGTCLSGCISVNQGSRPLGSIIGQTETLPEPGQWCRITTPETRTGLFERRQTVVTGKVEAVDDEGIHLSEVTGRQLVRTPGLEKVPGIRRLFKNAGVGLEHERVVPLSGNEQIEIISKQEARLASSQAVARNLMAAVVPGPF